MKCGDGSAPPIRPITLVEPLQRSGHRSRLRCFETTGEVSTGHRSHGPGCSGTHGNPRETQQTPRQDQVGMESGDCENEG